MKLLSEQLEHLAARAKSVESKAAAFRNSAKAEQEAILKKAKQDTLDAKTKLDGKIDNLKEENKNFWGKVKAKHNEFVGREKQRISDVHQGIKKTDADLRATIAEEDAEASILFAVHALAIADETVLHALEARAYSDSL